MVISPQLGEFNRKLAEHRKLTLTLLSDPGNVVASRFNLAHRLPGDLREVYLGFGIDLDRFNGNGPWTLPVPARFVIDRSGIIRSADVNADYTVRPEPADTLEVLRSLRERSGTTQATSFQS